MNGEADSNRGGQGQEGGDSGEKAHFGWVIKLRVSSFANRLIDSSLETASCCLWVGGFAMSQPRHWPGQMPCRLRAMRA